MPLNLIQRVIQRSIFEVIRKVIVDNGYMPNINNYTLSDPNAQQQWDTDLEAIKNSSLGFAIELFGPSSNQAKGLKKVPRITLHPARIIPGDVGMDPYNPAFGRNPADLSGFAKSPVPFEMSNMQFDIRLVSGGDRQADQDIILNAIMYSAIGPRAFIPIYDKPDQRFFIHQYDYYYVPDTQEGAEEKVFSYQVDDVILLPETYTPTALINEITVETTLLELKSIVKQNGQIIGPYIAGEDLIIDLSGIKF